MEKKKKRYRLVIPPPGEFRVHWGRDEHDASYRGLVIAYGLISQGGAISSFLHDLFFSERYTWDGKKELSVVKELEAYGFDIESLDIKIKWKGKADGRSA